MMHGLKLEEVVVIASVEQWRFQRTIMLSIMEDKIMASTQAWRAILICRAEREKETFSNSSLNPRMVFYQFQICIKLCLHQMFQMSQVMGPIRVEIPWVQMQLVETDLALSTSLISETTLTITIMDSIQLVTNLSISKRSINSKRISNNSFRIHSRTSLNSSSIRVEAILLQLQPLNQLLEDKITKMSIRDAEVEPWVARIIRKVLVITELVSRDHPLDTRTHPKT